MTTGGLRHFLRQERRQRQDRNNIRLTLGGPDAANYTVTQPTTTASITPRALTITANNTGKVYGAVLPVFTVSYTGLAGSDSAPATLPTVTTTATATSSVGTYPITASGAADNNYTIFYVPGTLTITPASLTIKANNQTMIYGSTLPALTVSYTGLAGGDSAPATLPTVTTTATATSSVGTYPITASGAADNNYTISYVPGTLTITLATPVIIWPAPAGITYGTALSATQLDATSSVAGTFTYNPIAGTILGAGSHTLSVNFVPNDIADYGNASATTSINVAKFTPIITWANPSFITYGTPLSATQLNATTSVPGTFNYNPNAGTILGAGSQTLSVTFTPTDTTDYNNASATTSINVMKVNPVITWNAPAGITYGTALSATQLDATSSVAGTFTYNPTAGTILAVGSHALSVNFTPSDNTDYNNASATTSINVSPATPTLIKGQPCRHRLRHGLEHNAA